MPQTFLIIVLILLTNLNIYACRCIDVFEFSEVYKKTDLVAFVRVAKYTEFYQSNSTEFPTVMQADIIYTHLGKANKRTITIHGGDGGSCVDLIEKSLFKNKYLIVALYKYGDNYSLGSCGRYTLNLTIWVYLFYLIIMTLITFLGFRYFKRSKKTISANT